MHGPAEKTDAKPEDNEHLPILPEIPEAEPFPVDHLPQILADAVKAIVSRRQVPEAMAAQSVLAVASLTCQPFADVNTPVETVTPLSLYIVTLAPTGARKSASDNDAMLPIGRYVNDLRADHGEKRSIYDNAADAYDIERKTALKKKSAADRKYAIEQLPTKPKPPLDPISTFADITFEALTKLWPNMHASLGLFSADGGSFLGGWSAKGEGKLLAGAGLSMIWDGKPYQRMRAGDGTILLFGRRLAVHLLVQPDAALEFLTDPTFKAQGFHSRVLLAMPPNLVGTRFYREPDPSAAQKLAAYADHLHAMITAAWPLADNALNELKPRVINLDENAKDLWREFYDKVEGEVGKDGRYSDLAGFGEKAGEIVCRIAGIFALIKDPGATVIDELTMLDAIAVMEWYLTEATRVREWASSARIIAAKTGEANAAYAFDKATVRLLEWARKEAGKAKTFVTTRKYIMQYGPSETRLARNLHVALATLFDAGHAEPEPTPPTAPPRWRPKIIFNFE